MNGIKSFSIYDTYYRLVKLLPEEQRGSLINKILEYVFEDKEPSDLTEEQESIWINLKRPIDISKKQALNVQKRWSENTKKDTKLDTKQNTKLDTKTNTKKDTQSKMSMSMSNVNVDLENKGVTGGKETFKVASDGSLLSETTKRVIDKLNDLAGTNFRSSSSGTKAKIQARLNEGYTLDDFIVVIENKVADWKGTDMAKYLRPETLFGNKFEGYLNQSRKVTGNPFIESLMEEYENE